MDEMNNTPGGTPPSTPAFCPRCGKPLPPDAVFCGECGTHLATGRENLAAYKAPAEDTAPLKTTDYLLLFLLNLVPIAGLIVMLVWAFSQEGNVNRRNFCRAWLIYYAISVGLGIILYVAAIVIMLLLAGDPTGSEFAFSALSAVFRG